MTRSLTTVALMMLITLTGCTRSEEAPAEAAPAPEKAEEKAEEKAPAPAEKAAEAPAEAAQKAEVEPAKAPAAAGDAPSLVGTWSVDVEGFKNSPMFSQMPPQQQAMMGETLGKLSFEFTETDFVYGHGDRKISRKYTIDSHADGKSVLGVTDDQGIKTSVTVAWTDSGITIQEQNRPGPLPLVRN